MNPISELVKCAMISSRMQRVEILPNDLKRKNTIIIESYVYQTRISERGKIHNF